MFLAYHDERNSARYCIIKTQNSQSTSYVYDDSIYISKWYKYTKGLMIPYPVPYLPVLTPIMLTAYRLFITFLSTFRPSSCVSLKRRMSYLASFTVRSYTFACRACTMEAISVSFAHQAGIFVSDDWLE